MNESKQRENDKTFKSKEIPPHKHRQRNRRDRRTEERQREKGDSLALPVTFQRPDKEKFLNTKKNVL
jgi:hypothetical protein